MARGTPQDTRRQDSLKVLMRVIGMLVKRSIDDYVAAGKDQKLRQTIAKARPRLIKRSIHYRQVMNGIDDDRTAILVQDESGVLINLAFTLGLVQGTKIIRSHLMEKIHELMKENTSSARRIALNNKSPILKQKKKITIDAARSYMADRSNEIILTPNALVVKIYSDVEKQCKLNNIPVPSRTSVWTYLNEAKLLTSHV
jgi:hypothetical protein